MANTHSLDLEAGSSQYAAISDAAQTGLDITGDLTIEAYVKFESTPSSGNVMIIAGKLITTDNQRSYHFNLYNNAGTLQLAALICSDGAGTSQLAGTNWTPIIGAWYHVAMVYTASGGSIQFYVNAIVKGSAVTSFPTSIFNGTADFAIGQVNGGNFFDGKVDDVRVWNATRTTAQIVANARAELSGSETNLQGYWKLNNDYLDATANNNDLTASGSPAFSTDYPSIFDGIIDNYNSYIDGDLTAQGGWSGHATFDVQGSVVQEGAKAISNADAAARTIVLTFTDVGDHGVLSWWCRRTNTTTYGCYVRWDSADGNINGGAYLNDNGTFKFITDAGELDSGISYSADTWVNIKQNVNGVSNRVRYAIGSGAYGAWGALASNTGWNNVLFKKQPQTVTDYWDNLTFAAEPTVSETIDDFNALNTADLTGQNGWIGDTQFDVQTGTVQEGAKAVSMVDSNLVGYNIAKTIFPRTTNIFRVGLRSTGTNTLGTFSLYDGSTFEASVALRPDGTILFQTNVGSASFGAYSANTWYVLDIEIDQANSQMRARKDSGTWSDWKVSTFTNIDTLKLTGGSDNTGVTIFWDNITFIASTDYSLSPTETVLFSESSMKSEGLIKSEQLSISESFAKLSGSIVMPAETVNFTESHSIAQDTPFSEQLSLQESHSSDPGKSLADSVVLDEDLMREIGKVFSETESLTESSQDVAGTQRDMTESVSLTDSFSRSLEFLRTLAETISLAEQLSKGTSLTFDETVQFFEFLSKHEGSALADTFTIAESFIHSIGKGASDTIEFSESLTKAFGRMNTDLLSFTEAYSIASQRLLSENISISEVITGSEKVTQVDALESIVFSESHGTGVGSNKSDSVSLTEQLSKESASFITVSELLSISETITKHYGKVNSESFSFSEMLLSTLGLSKIESLQFSESMMKSMGKSFVELETLQETSIFANQYFLSHSEQFDVQDSHAKSKMKELQEMFVLAEVLTRATDLKKTEMIVISEQSTRLFSSDRRFVESMQISENISKGLFVDIIDMVALDEDTGRDRGWLQTETELISFVDSISKPVRGTPFSKRKTYLYTTDTKTYTINI